MKIRKKAELLALGVVAAVVFPASAHAWNGETWGSMTRAAIESRANQMIFSKWTPKNTIRNFGVGSTYYTFQRGTTYTGMAYSQNNPQENWSEFYKAITNTGGGTTYYGNDCSGFVSIAWKLPSRYTTWTFEDDAVKSGGYVSSLGAVGSGHNVNLQLGDALNRSNNHIILFKKKVSGGVLSLEQTPRTARSREWTWSQLSSYRPIRRNSLATSSTAPSPITGTVTTNGGTLTVRAGASTSFSAVDTLANGAKVTIQCKVSGQSISGKLGTTNQWYRIGTSKFVSAAYMSASQAVPVCK